MGKFCWDKFKPYYSPIRKSAPDYSHLLPDGYEFCSEQDAVKWVKVEMFDAEGENEYGFVVDGKQCCNKPHYRPIRPIQYKVTTHEIVNAVPSAYSIEKHGDGWAIYQGRDLTHHGANLGQIHDEKLAQYIGDALKGFKVSVPDPYMPDWSKAPEGTVAHAWDEDGTGFWCTIKLDKRQWRVYEKLSNLTLPADLDWKQSLRVKPN
jgi:hypothetical protein